MAGVFSQPHMEYPLREVLGIKDTITNLKKMGIVQNVFSGKEKIKLEVNDRKIDEIYQNIWRLKTYLLK